MNLIQLEGSELADKLVERLARRQALIGVIGLGYVGLPISLVFAEAGARVLGFDIDGQKAEDINAGRSYLRQFPAARIASVVAKGQLQATADLGRLGEPDVIVICVPTPLTKQLTPDLSSIKSTGESIVKSLRKGQMIILESTTYPGTTIDFLKPILESSGLLCGEDFFLAFSPEREDPGNDMHTTKTIPKVVGADDDNSRALATAVYTSFGVQTVPVTSSSTAEAVKITENIFRAVNIALVNELKVIYSAMGINIWEVIEAAKTKPFGYMPFYPGPGLGGHCIPIDPFYLTWKAREYELNTRFIELAGQINTAMPDHIVDILARSVDAQAGRGLNGARILIMGIAYKKNVDDTRESPSLRLIEKIEGRGATVAFYDPFIREVPVTREHPNLAGRTSIPWSHTAIAGYDAVVIVTDHDEVDYAGLAEHAKLVVDTRNACARAGADMTRVVLA